MKLSFVSITNAILDWTQERGVSHEEISQEVLIKWATDCIRWMSVPETYRHRVGLIQIKNSRAEMPSDFVLLMQAAANVYPYEPCNCDADPECCQKREFAAESTPKKRRETITQWVQGTLEKDCNLEINLVCPKCHTSSCNCDTSIVEVDVDRIWEMAHPEIYYKHYTRLGRHGYGGEGSSYYNPKFKLMRYASGDYFNLKHLLTDCPNVDCKDCGNQFVINLPYIEVDFEEGEVLISYLGKAMDENGDLMIPDHPDCFAAIFWHLENKYWYKKNNLDKAEYAERKREDAIGKARSAILMPEQYEVKEWMENYHFKRVPDHNYMNKMRGRTTGTYTKYGRFLGE